MTNCFSLLPIIITAGCTLGIGICVIMINRRILKLSEKKRKDDLFIIRYNFFQKMGRFWNADYILPSKSSLNTMPEFNEYIREGDKEKSYNNALKQMHHDNVLEKFRMLNELEYLFGKEAREWFFNSLSGREHQIMLAMKDEGIWDEAQVGVFKQSGTVYCGYSELTSYFKKFLSLDL